MGSPERSPAPRPKSPPELYGKRRELAKVVMLEREIGFLEEELKSIETLQPASSCIKEVADYVGTIPEPLITVCRKTRKSCAFWKWLLCGSSCVNNLSCVCCCYYCCDGCSLKMPHCCSLPDCCSCSLPKCVCAIKPPSCHITACLKAACLKPCLFCCTCNCNSSCCSDCIPDCSSCRQCRCSKCCCWPTKCSWPTCSTCGCRCRCSLENNCCYSCCCDC